MGLASNSERKITVIVVHAWTEYDFQLVPKSHSSIPSRDCRVVHMEPFRRDTCPVYTELGRKYDLTYGKMEFQSFQTRYLLTSPWTPLKLYPIIGICQGLDMGSIQIGQLSPGFHSNAPRTIFTNFSIWKRTRSAFFFASLVLLNNSSSMKEPKQVHVKRYGWNRCSPESTRNFV